MDTFSRLGLAAGVTLVIAALGWLVLDVAGPHPGVQRLAEVPGARVEAIADGAPALTRDEVAAKPDIAWQPWTASGYLSAKHGDVIWLRVRLANPGAEPVEGVLADTSYFSDQSELWWSDRPGQWRHALSGDAVPGGEKALWSRTAAWRVTVPAGGERQLFLRVSDRYLAHIQPVWWAREQDFFATQIRGVVAECCCYGAMLALVCYNAVLWLRLRFADTGYYVLLAAASMACNFVTNGGLALLGLATGSPLHEMLMAGAFALGGLGMVQFARVFLGTAELLPRTDRWLRGWRWMLMAVGLVVLTMPWMTTPVGLTVAAFAALLTDVLCMGVAVTAWRSGAKHARFFAAAFGPLLVGAGLGLVSLVRRDIVPGTALGLLAGRTLEMLLLSFAVAERFAQTQRRLLAETEQRRLMEETYSDELELEVRERTRELAEASADKDRMLAVIGHDLRSPLTGLMRSADQVPGDFAREVTRTGRELLLLIEDIVVWARLRAGTGSPGLHPAHAVVVPGVALHRALAQQGGTQLVLEVREDLRVATDLVLAQTLVRNLLANALKFARSQVVLRVEEDGAGGVRFTVGNDGPPLPPEVAARFAAGRDEPLSATGGLGLRLCREICRALGNRLEATTGPQGGTEFSFVLRAAARPPT